MWCCLFFRGGGGELGGLGLCVTGERNSSPVSLRDCSSHGSFWGPKYVAQGSKALRFASPGGYSPRVPAPIYSVQAPQTSPTANKSTSPKSPSTSASPPCLRLHLHRLLHRPLSCPALCFFLVTLRGVVTCLAAVWHLYGSNPDLHASYSPGSCFRLPYPRCWQYSPCICPLRLFLPLPKACTYSHSPSHSSSPSAAISPTSKGS